MLAVALAPLPPASRGGGGPASCPLLVAGAGGSSPLPAFGTGTAWG